MKTLVIYPGRFQPFHKGHKASYDHLLKKFDDAYIATSGVQAPVTSPFSFQDKLDMITRTGIPAGRVARVKNPYRADEIVSEIPDKEDTALIFAVSEKDADRFSFGKKRDGSPSYMQPYVEGAKLAPLTKHAYVYITPTVNFKVKGVDANSASQIRKLYMDGNDSDRDTIITDLYGELDHGLRSLFDQKLLPAKAAQELINKEKTADMLPEHRKKLAKLLENVKRLEKRAQLQEQAFTEDLLVDYIEEK